MEVTQKMFEQQRFPRFGNANPERMWMPFWELMARNKESAYWARKHFNDMNLSGGAIWCFDRFGMSQTMLPDGRIIYIAGEHEDFYDPDFYIYNDVIVFYPDGQIDIFGYPREVFPPTDFHTATLVGSKIYVIGNLSYIPDRKPTLTPVYQLDVDTFQIRKLETHGENPGWIFKHEAELNESNSKITLRKGQLFTGNAGELEQNLLQYQLDLATLQWKKLNE